MKIIVLSKNLKSRYYICVYNFINIKIFYIPFIYKFIIQNVNNLNSPKI